MSIFHRQSKKATVMSLVGVEKVSVPRKKRLSRYEQSLLDVKEGRVYEAESVDDLFNLL